MFRQMTIVRRTGATRLVTLVSAVALFSVIFLVVIAPRYPRTNANSKASIFFSNGNGKNVPDYSPQLANHGKPFCPETSNLLSGSIKVDTERAAHNYWEESKLSYSNRSADMGQHRPIAVKDIKLLKPQDILRTPEFCESDLKIAIIIPFRDREEHLKVLLGHLTPILRRQLIAYSIFVVEQWGGETFNKGRLMNTGFEIANLLGETLDDNYDCYIFQDVDLLPERDDLLYRCHEGPYVDHLSPAINKFDYKPVCCGMTVGGVLAFKADEYRKVNGFSNSYWGWGGEDDDMNVRIRKQALKILRPDPEIGRYSMIKHTKDEGNPKNAKAMKELRKSWTHSENDGLVDLNTEIKELHVYPIFTKVLVDVKSPRIT